MYLPFVGGAWNVNISMGLCGCEYECSVRGAYACMYTYVRAMFVCKKKKLGGRSCILQRSTLMWSGYQRVNIIFVNNRWIIIFKFRIRNYDLLNFALFSTSTLSLAKFYLTPLIYVYIRIFKFSHSFRSSPKLRRRNSRVPIFPTRMFAEIESAPFFAHFCTIFFRDFCRTNRTVTERRRQRRD